MYVSPCSWAWAESPSLPLCPLFRSPLLKQGDWGMNWTDILELVISFVWLFRSTDDCSLVSIHTWDKYPHSCKHSERSMHIPFPQTFLPEIFQPSYFQVQPDLDSCRETVCMRSPTISSFRQIEWPQVHRLQFWPLWGLFQCLYCPLGLLLNVAEMPLLPILG